ncbi:MAG: hypothetical protein LC676_08085, partial [Loktanella sp.]|nr:hypothetical protein [Loktanella sp.]
ATDRGGRLRAGRVPKATADRFDCAEQFLARTRWTPDPVQHAPDNYDELLGEIREMHAKFQSGLMDLDDTRCDLRRTEETLYDIRSRIEDIGQLVDPNVWPPRHDTTRHEKKVEMLNLFHGSSGPSRRRRSFNRPWT